MFQVRIDKGKAVPISPDDYCMESASGSLGYQSVVGNGSYSAAGEAEHHTRECLPPPKKTYQNSR